MNLLPTEFALSYLEENKGVYPEKNPTWEKTIQDLYKRGLVFDDVNFDRKRSITARTVAKLPVFVPENLQDLVTGRIEVYQLESAASVFDAYVASLPTHLKEDGKRYRAWLIRQESAEWPRKLALIPGSGPHGGLAGNYLHVHLCRYGSTPESHQWVVSVQDCDDGLIQFAGAERDAITKFAEVTQMSPLNLNELTTLGFSYQ